MWRDAQWVGRMLAKDSGEAQAELMQWSATNSRTEVADTLLTVLSRNPPQTSLEAGCALAGISIVAIIAICVGYSTGSLIPLVIVILPSIIVSQQNIRRPKIAKRAALMLARLNDPRSIRPLIGSWRDMSFSRENEPLAEEITRLLNEVVTREPTSEITFPLRDFVERYFVGTTKAYGQDLTELETDMFVATLRCLSRSSSPLMRDVLERVARLKSAESNRGVVIDAARVLIEPQPAPIPVSITASLPPDPVQQRVGWRD